MPLQARRLLVFGYRGPGYCWRAASQPGYLGDFGYADADNDGQPELVMVVKFQHKGLTNKARSSIVIYELE